MNILQYNILDGCQEEARFDGLSRWIRSQAGVYDVIGLNELNGWSPERLAFHASRWGYSHSYLYETRVSPYYVGIVSKHPLQLVGLTEKPFHHGLLHVKANGVHFLITHLCSSDSMEREREADYIANTVSRISEPLLVMGDLNTLSPHDDGYYKEYGLLETLESDDKLSRKFVVRGKLNYRPMQILLDAGLSDTGHGADFQFSVPTSMNRDQMHAARMRLDYVLVNDALRKKHPVSSIIRDEKVEELSDHCPVRCEWTG
ncbi:MAG: hypothetical protein K0Q94_803 [Paenibacillus sp.]|jgi:endonuclease/exonuclease/phosphatase family metal-dependent hydrolase|nr:hypothetical protein [Paenibacillus sp.]